MAKVELDTVVVELDTVVDGEYGETAEDAAKIITKGFNVQWEIVAECGPGGGNPIIRYVGRSDDIRQMVTEHYGLDAVDLYTL